MTTLLTLFSIVFGLEKCADNFYDFTVEHSRKLCQQSNVINLSEYQGISDDCLQVFINSKKPVNLNGLKKISKKQALIIAQSVGFVYLDGLENIPFNILSIFAEAKCGFSFGGLKKITVDQTEKLSKIKVLHLNGLLSLDEKCAIFFGKNHGSELQLNSLQSVSNNTLQYLASSSREIMLGGLKTLTNEQAKIISDGSASFVLQGIEYLEDSKLACLNNCNNFIYLTGIKSLSKTFSKLYRNGVGKLEFQGLEVLNKDIIESYITLGKNPRFAAVKKIDGDVAKLIGGLKISRIYLPSLTEIAPDQAFWLGMGCGTLDLSGLSEIDNISLDYISRFFGSLNLGGLKFVSNEQAKILSKHVGFLDLSGVTHIDQSASHFFRSHIGSINFGGIKTISNIAFYNVINIKDFTYKNVLFSDNYFAITKSVYFYSDFIHEFNGLTIRDFYTQTILENLEEINHIKAFFLLFQDKFKVRLAPKKVNFLALLLMCISGTSINFENIENKSLFYYFPLFIHYGSAQIDDIKNANNIEIFLISCNKGFLVLNNLETITDFGACMLSLHNNAISITDLKEISYNQAKILSKKGHYIYISKTLINITNDKETKHLLGMYPFIASRD